MAAVVFEALSEAFRLRRALEEISLDRRSLIGALHARDWAKPEDFDKALHDATSQFEQAEEDVIRAFDGEDEEVDPKPWWETKPEHAPGPAALTGEEVDQ